MAAKVLKVLVISGNGTNCETETAYACRKAGADVVDIVHIYRLINGSVRINDYDFINLPGGFLDGDDLGSAKAHAARLRHAKTPSGLSIFEDLCRFISDGKIILGICNGFQLLVKLGLIPDLSGNYDKQDTTLTFNDSGRFEDRWVYLKVNPLSPCVFTKGIKSLYLPVRHGEGKFIAENGDVLEQIRVKNLVAVQYSDSCSEKPVMEYPYNPNGSVEAIAGICDTTGRVFGMMPHAEGYNHYTNHPCWTRGKISEDAVGIDIFRNGIEYIRKNL